MRVVNVQVHEDRAGNADNIKCPTDIQQNDCTWSWHNRYACSLTHSSPLPLPHTETCTHTRSEWHEKVCFEIISSIVGWLLSSTMMAILVSFFLNIIVIFIECYSLMVWICWDRIIFFFIKMLEKYINPNENNSNNKKLQMVNKLNISSENNRWVGIWVNFDGGTDGTRLNVTIGMVGWWQTGWRHSNASSIVANHHEELLQIDYKPWESQATNNLQLTSNVEKNRMIC